MSSLQAAKGISASEPSRPERIPYSLYSGWHKSPRTIDIAKTVRLMQRAAKSSLTSITFFQMITWTNLIKVTVLANRKHASKLPKYVLKSQAFTTEKLVYLGKKKLFKESCYTLLNDNYLMITNLIIPVNVCKSSPVVHWAMTELEMIRLDRLLFWGSPPYHS